MNEEELAELQKIAAAFAEGLESKLATKLDEAIAGIDEKIKLNAEANAALQEKAKAAFEQLPEVIKNQVAGQLQVNLKGIIEEVSNQFEEKVKALASGAGAGPDGAGLSLNNLLAHSDQIISIVNAFRSPTTEQAMMSQMNFVMRWHSLLTKLEKGGGSGDEVTKAIADTFTEKPG